MADRVSVNRQELQAFLAENDELVERYQELLEKLGTLRKLNEDLEQKLRFAEQKLSTLKQNLADLSNSPPHLQIETPTTLPQLSQNFADTSISRSQYRHRWTATGRLETRPTRFCLRRRRFHISSQGGTSTP